MNRSIDSRNREINEMLRYLAEVARSNPEMRFNTKQSHNLVYGMLIHNGVKQEDRTTDLSSGISKDIPNLTLNPDAISYYAHPQSTFNNWIQLFSKRKTNVFVDPEWSYFCQFISENKQARQAREHLKIYIPLDAEHIEFGAKMIFEFLEQQNIPHLSKIGRAIRFDDIVVRLVNPNDVDKLLDFVKNNSYLKEGLIKPNPFAFQKDGIAMAVDGSLSYNSTVASLMELYTDNRRRTNKLDTVSVEDFYNFVYQKYKGQFIDRNDNTLQNFFNWDSQAEANNYRQVMQLLINAHSPNFSFKDYLEHYAQCAGIQLEDQRTVSETNEMLLEALQAMTLRFDHPTGFWNVEGFFHSGQPTLITSKNGLRSRMVNSTFRQSLANILKKNNMSFSQYASQLLQKNGIDLAELDRERTLA